MPQGWNINATTDFITFYEVPAAASAIQVKEFGAAGRGGTNIWAVGAWSPRFGYPQEVEFFNDRLWFTSTPTDSQTIWASSIGDYYDFGRSSPIVDSDSVSFAINSRQVNTVKELVPLDSLLLLTTGGEYKTTGGQDDVVTPSTIGVKNQGNSGIGDVPAKLIGESAVFVQQEGQKVRDLRYTFEKDGFRGNDISVWADHLFEGHEVQAIEHWKAPWGVLWFIREDGVRVGCTYMPEQEVIGWHWHDTDGRYLDACALPGTKESECYFLVERFIDGEVVQYIEQQAATRFEEEADMFFVDGGLVYDGRNLTSTTLTITTAADWTENDELTFTASSPIFTGATDVGDGFEVTRDITAPGEDGVLVTTTYTVRLLIDEYVSGTTVRGHSVGDVPEALRAVPTASWTFRRDTIDNLWHLEGKSVNVLQDAAVAGPYVVTDGKVLLDYPGGVVQTGLPYVCEVETLELNSAGGESMRDQMKLAYKVSILVLASRGVFAGGVNEQKYPIPERRFENYGQPPFLKTGVFDCNIPAGWGVDAGRVRISSTDPLPMEILSITTRAVASEGQAGGARS